jgi:hypothetical protein
MCRNVFSGAVFRVAGLLGNAEVPFGGLCVYRSHLGLACMCNAEAGNLELSGHRKIGAVKQVQLCLLID